MTTMRRFAGFAVFGVLLIGAGARADGVRHQAWQVYAETVPVRTVVDQTQNDLREASGIEHSGGNKEHERYRNAQKSLSDFDRRLTKNHFDKGKLDKAIQDIQSILDHNTLQGSSRDNLLRDVSQLRDARRNHR